MLKQKYNLIGNEAKESDILSVLLISFFTLIAILFGFLSFGYGLSTFFNLTIEKNDRIAKDMIIMSDIQNLYSIANSSTTNINITAGVGTSFATIDNNNPSESINLSNISGVAGNWTNPQLTVNNQGRITSIINGNSGGLTTQKEGVTTGTVAGVSTLNFVGNYFNAVGVGNTTTITALNIGSVHCIMSRNFMDGFQGIINWNIRISDPLNMYNNGTQGAGGTAGIVVPVTGIYRVNLSMYSTGAGLNVQILIDGVFRAGTISAVTSDWYNVGLIYPINAGQKVSISANGPNFGGVADQNLYNFAVIRRA